MARTSRRDAQPDQGSGLTDAQERFCLEYVVDLNATRAYKAAYPRSSAAAAESSGSRLLRNVKVAARVQALIEERAARVQVNADDVLRELLAVGTSDIDDVELDGRGRLVLREGAKAHARKAVSSVKMKRRLIPQGEDQPPIEEITTEIKLWNKNESLRMLSQHLGLLKEAPPVPEGTGVLMVPAPTTAAAWDQMVKDQAVELAKPLTKKDAK